MSWCTSYGKRTISSKSTAIHRWKLHLKPPGYAAIGIADTSCTTPEKFHDTDFYFCYAYQNDGIKYFKTLNDNYGIQWKEDVVIEMTLDLSSGSSGALSFKVNGKNQGVAYYVKQSSNLKYRMAVSFFNSGCYTLLSYNNFYKTNDDAKQNDDNTNINIIKSFKKQILNQKDIIKQYQTSSNNKDDEILILKTQIQSLNHEKERLNKLLFKLKTELNESKNVINDLNTFSQKKDNQIYELCKKLDLNMVQIKSLKIKNLKLISEQNEMIINMNNLKKKIQKLKKNKKIDLKRYKEWDSSDVVNWIFSINNGLFMKLYGDKLKKEIIDSELSGNDLIEMNINDMKAFGIKKFADRKLLEKNIKILINSQNNNNNNIVIGGIDNDQKEGALDIGNNVQTAYH